MILNDQHRDRGIFQPNILPSICSISCGHPTSQNIPLVTAADHFIRSIRSLIHKISHVRQLNLPSLRTLTIMPCRLSNLFNAIPRTSSLRLVVYNTLLDLATANDELEVLQLSRGDVEKWLTEWDITPDEKSAFLKRIVGAYQKADQLYVPTIGRRSTPNIISSTLSELSHMNTPFHTYDRCPLLPLPPRTQLSISSPPLFDFLSFLTLIPCSN
jgi:hypothetical protein